MSQPTEDQLLVTAAVDKWQELATRGDAEAQFRLGECYMNGEGVAKDAERGMILFRAAAEQGHAGGQSGLGYCYLYGEGLTKDAEKAVFWIRAAAEQGHAGGQANLGLCYLNGLGLTKDAEQAVFWFRAAAEQGHAGGQSGLGYCYLYGEGLTKDAEKALFWIRAAAEQGHAGGQANLGLCYLNGWGLTKDVTEAVKLFRAAAGQGHAGGQANLGLCYLNGWGLTKDVTEAVKLFRAAAEQDHVGGRSGLGYCYLSGLGLTKDVTEAVKWLRVAAVQGDAWGQTNLGMCYLNGLGLTKDAEQAVELFRAAAEQGNASAQLRLGFCSLFGWGVSDRDAEKAVVWFRAAAKQDDAGGQLLLGYCYLIGLGVERNAEQAVFWLRAAAEQGDASAQTMLGICCFKGEGIAKNAKHAVTWFRAAAKQGDALAQTMLGMCYWAGEGVDRDAEVAMDCLKSVAEQEDFLAQLVISYMLSVSRDTPAYDDMNSETWLIRLATTPDLNINRSQVFITLHQFEFVTAQLKPHWNFLREKCATFPPAKVALARLIKAHFFDGQADTNADMPDPDALIAQAAEANDLSGMFYEGLRHFEAERYEESKKYFNLAMDAMKEKKEPQISSLLHSAMTNLGGSTPVVNYPQGVIIRLLGSTNEKLRTIHEIELREAEMQKRKAIEDLMAMFSHQFRGAVGTILFNTEHENDKTVYVHTARAMSGLLDIAGVLSTSPEYLQANLARDGAGQATPLSTLTASLRDLIVDLTSQRNRERLSPYYKSHAQRQGWVSPDITLSEWSQTGSCQQYEQTLQAEWDAASHALIHADIGALQRWMEQRWLPLHITGFDEDYSSFSDYGPKASLLRVILTEILKNAIKHSDPNAARPILLEWSNAEVGLSIRCTNHSTRATRMREKSKGSGRGLKFLRMIASNLEGKLDEDLYSEPSSVCIHLTKWPSRGDS